MFLLLGGRGYVGQAFQRQLRIAGEPFQVVSRTSNNYYSRDSLISLIRDCKPAFVLNTAGYTGKPNVDACENDKSECLMGNAVLPGIINEACEATKTAWGHVSSGCIYSGRRKDGGGFKEADEPNFSFRNGPCSFYSGTKALGEEVLEDAESCYTWRLRIPFDHRDGPRNYLSKLQNYSRLLEAENSISNLDDFVRACLECWHRRIPFGCYNMTNPGAVTTTEVTQLLSTYLCPEKTFAFFRDEVDFMSNAAQTPRSSCVLDSTKLKEAGVTMPDARDALVRAMKCWEAERKPAIR